MPDNDPSEDDTPEDKPKPPDHAAEAEKWKALARKHEQQAKANADAAQRLKELEDRDKSESDKLKARISELEKERDIAAATAMRLEVAAEKGVKPRWLSGSTRDELEAAADEYLADHPTAGGTPPPGKPKEDLRGGGDPDEEPDELDPRKLAARHASPY